MNKAITATVLASISIAFAGTQNARAHHSFPAQYDESKPVTLTGKITRVEWTNPHIFIYIDVTDEDTSEAESWALELGGPNALLRLGWKRDSLQPGDIITVEGSLARDGSNLANAGTIVMTETGQRMLAGSSQDAVNP
jgi:hypothetical protein